MRSKTAHPLGDEGPVTAHPLGDEAPVAGANLSANHPSIIRILIAASDGTKGPHAAGNWGGWWWWWW